MFDSPYLLLLSGVGPYTYSTSQKFGHTYSFKAFLIYFHYFLHCIIIVKRSKLLNNTWNHVVTTKVLNKSKYILDFRFFKVATLCLDDSFAHSWHSLDQLHLKCFSKSLYRVPTYAGHLLAAFTSLSSPTHPRPSQLV